MFNKTIDGGNSLMFIINRMLINLKDAIYEVVINIIYQAR